MQLLVVGDVHACYYTLQKLVANYWDASNTLLIQLGDLINKGPFTSKCIDYWMRLQEKHPGKVVWLQGNHEYALLQKYTDKPTSESLLKLSYALKKRGRSLEDVMAHIKALPLVWEDGHFYISHAGIAKNEDNPFALNGPRSVLNNREQLKTLEQVQIVGHNVVEGSKPVFSPKENAWYIDTGAWTKKYLSALFINENREVKVIRQRVEAVDQPDFSL
jgi:serine/threonine protein phosphatase 1